MSWQHGLGRVVGKCADRDQGCTPYIGGPAGESLLVTGNEIACLKSFSGLTPFWFSVSDLLVHQSLLWGQICCTNGDYRLTVTSLRLSSSQ
jgi:hypothetical protein